MAVWKSKTGSYFALTLALWFIYESFFDPHKSDYFFITNQSGTTNNVPFRFSGSITLRDKKSSDTNVAGSLVLPLADYHWADANRDNRIEDAEILAAYDTFSALDNVNYDWQKIDEIWSGAGYHWDENKQEYIIRQ